MRNITKKMHKLFLLVIVLIVSEIAVSIMLQNPQIRSILHRTAALGPYNIRYFTIIIMCISGLLLLTLFCFFCILGSKMGQVKNKTVKCVCLMVFLLVIIFNAWQADDAYLSHIISYNFANGNGLVFNVGERVLVSTCPLHTIVIGVVYKLFGHIYISSLVICILYSVVAVVILFWFSCRNNRSVILATILLILCKSFVSYTTSGLENSLLFLLFAILLYLYMKHDVFDARHITLLAFVTSLILLTRMDNALLALPIIGFIVFRRKTAIIKALLCVFIGMLPFIAWEIFSIFYYGFPFPNTAYAKLGTNIPLFDYILRGTGYYIGAFVEDGLVLVLPIIFIVISFIGTSCKYKILSSGIFLYYLYVIYIGGDFMAGRHFTVPFFISLFCILSEFDKKIITIKMIKENIELYIKNKVLRINKIIVLVLILILCLQSISGFIHFPLGIYADILLPISGHDERNLHFPYTSLITRINKLIFNNPNAIDITDRELEEYWLPIIEGRAKNYKGDSWRAVSGISIVYFGNFGNGFYISDRHALWDPLYARLPAKYEKNWYIGHMWRESPAGYRESLQTGENHIIDPDLKEYLNILWDIIRSDKIFTKERIRKIININLGKYNYLINKYIERQKMFLNTD